MSDSKMKNAELANGPEWLNNPDIFVFSGEKELPVGATERHGLADSLGSLFGRSREQVKEEWQKALDQIQFLLNKVSTNVGEYELEEISFELGFSAEGKVVFIAKGGIQTTIQATFKKRKQS